MALFPGFIIDAVAGFVKPLVNGWGFRLYGSTSGSVGFKPKAIAGSVDYVLPSVDGSSGDVLSTDGSANLSWLTISESGGTVTTVSVVSANGLAGTVANPTTTPAITLSTTVTGILKGDGTTISTASSGDFPTLNQNTTGSAATLTTPRAINGVNFDGSSAITITAAPSGSAGGDLTGTFPNPTIGTNKVTYAKMQQASAATVLGNSTGSTANVSEIGIASLPTASTLALRDSNGNTLFNNAICNVTSTVSASGTTVLTAASTQAQILTGTLAQNYQLPSATTLSNNTIFEFNNNSTQALTIKNNGGSTIATVSPGGFVRVILLSNGTTNGTWDYHYLLSSNTTSSTSGLSIGGTVSASNFSGTSSGTNTGDQTSITGNAGTATALQTARNINGVAFDGTASITITAAPSGSVGGDLTGTYPNPTIKSSVGLSGSPTTTTQSANDNSTKIATTAYVDTADALHVLLGGKSGGQTVYGDTAADGKLVLQGSTNTNAGAVQIPVPSMLALGNNITAALATNLFYPYNGFNQSFMFTAHDKNVFPGFPDHILLTGCNSASAAAMAEVPLIGFATCRGPITAVNYLQTGDKLGGFNFYNPSPSSGDIVNSQAAQLSVAMTENQTDLASGTKFLFSTTATGTNTHSVSFVIENEAIYSPNHANLGDNGSNNFGNLYLTGTVSASNFSGSSSGTNTGDQTISDATISITDITTNNVSTTKHGFAPKLPNDATKYLDGTGAYSVPAGSGGGSGTVTTISVVSTNGFAGTVANATTTPAITLTTTITGILKGNGTAISAATAGSDYLTVLTGDVTTSSNTATIAANAVTHAKLVQSTAYTVVGNATGSTANVSDLSAIILGTPSYTTAGGNFSHFTLSTNNFAELAIQNTAANSSASTDFIATANNGNDTTHYVDVGINSSLGGVAPFTNANAAYLYTTDNELDIAALGSTGVVKIWTNATPTLALTIDQNQNPTFVKPVNAPFLGGMQSLRMIW